MRHDAVDLLGIEGDFNEVTGDGSQIVCNVHAELAIAQRRIESDFHLVSACARRPDVAAICGLQLSHGGKHGSTPGTAAYAIVGAMSSVAESESDDTSFYVHYIHTSIP